MGGGDQTSLLKVFENEFVGCSSRPLYILTCTQFNQSVGNI